LKTAPVTCPKCNGEGYLIYKHRGNIGDLKSCNRFDRQKCPICNGSGFISENINDCFTRKLT